MTLTFSYILTTKASLEHLTKVGAETSKSISPSAALHPSSPLTIFPYLSYMLSPKRTQQTQYHAVSMGPPRTASSRLLLSQKSSNLFFCMYKYKSWQNMAACPVASLDEEHLMITKPSPVHHPLPHPKPITTLPTPLNALPHTSFTQSIVPRRPQAGCKLIPSSLRPHVAAMDRIRHWQTLHSRSFNSQVASYLPANLVDSSFKMIYRSLAPATRSTYSAGLLRFTQFCDKYNISESDCMPASFILLVAFISEHAGTVSGKTISGWLSGLKARHDTNSAEWCGDKRWV
jgi:hypothetical protein